MKRKINWGAILLLSITYGAQGATEEFKDWRYSCDTPDASCIIGQGLRYEESGVTYSAEISREPTSGTGVIRLNFPFGIYLPRNVGMAVGKHNREVPMLVCLPQGCHALIVIDKEILAGLQSEEGFKIRFYITSEQPREIEFSLSGFDQAYKRLARPPTTF